MIFPANPSKSDLSEEHGETHSGAGGAPADVLCRHGPARGGGVPRRSSSRRGTRPPLNSRGSSSVRPSRRSQCIPHPAHRNPSSGERRRRPGRSRHRLVGRGRPRTSSPGTSLARLRVGRGEPGPGGGGALRTRRAHPVQPPVGAVRAGGIRGEHPRVDPAGRPGVSTALTGSSARAPGAGVVRRGLGEPTVPVAKPGPGRGSRPVDPVGTVPGEQLHGGVELDGGELEGILDLQPGWAF